MKKDEILKLVNTSPILSEYNKKKPLGRIKVVKMEGEVIDGETLEGLQKQAGDIQSFDTLIVDIASQGGSVSEGLDIMLWQNILSEYGKTIISVVTANAYSIASLTMLAADIKLISKYGEVMVHNPMIPSLEYANANDLSQYVDELRELESVMYELYYIFANLDRDIAKNLMDNETFMKPEEALKYGFVDEIIEINERPYQMVKNDEKNINMSKTINALRRVAAKFSGEEIVNQVYYDKVGGKVEIFQNDPSTFKEGDKTNVKEGEVELSDGSMLFISNYVIDKIEKTSPMDSNVGEPPAEEKREEEVAAVQEEQETEKVEVVETEDVEKDVEPKAIDEDVMEMFEAMRVKMETMESRIEELEKMIIAGKDEAREFEQVVTDAVEKMAVNSTSTFKPKPKVSDEKPVNKSIFQTIRAKRIENKSK